MKKIAVVLVLALCILLCACGKHTSSSSSSQWDEGYESGYEAGYEAAQDDMHKTLSRAAEYVNKALGAMEDLPSKASKIDGIDDVYDALCKADNILSKYR